MLGNHKGLAAENMVSERDQEEVVRIETKRNNSFTKKREVSSIKRSSAIQNKKKGACNHCPLKSIASLKGNHSALTVCGIVNWFSHYEEEYGVSSKKLKLELQYNPSIPLLGIYPKEMKTGYGREICTPMFLAALFTIAKLWKQPK